MGKRRRIIKSLLRYDTCFNCFYWGGYMGKTTPKNPWWCYGGPKENMQKYERPESLRCENFRAWQSKEEMGL